MQATVAVAQRIVSHFQVICCQLCHQTWRAMHRRIAWLQLPRPGCICQQQWQSRSHRPAARAPSCKSPTCACNGQLSPRSETPQYPSEFRGEPRFTSKLTRILLLLWRRALSLTGIRPKLTGDSNPSEFGGAGFCRRDSGVRRRACRPHAFSDTCCSNSGSSPPRRVKSAIVAIASPKAGQVRQGGPSPPS